LADGLLPNVGTQSFAIARESLKNSPAFWGKIQESGPFIQ